MDVLSNAKFALLFLCLLLFTAIERVAPLQPGLRLDGRSAWLHALRNLGLAGISSAAAALLSLFTLLAALLANTHWQFGLLYALQAPAWLEWAMALLLFDLWQYLWHRANHRFDLLWRFHAIHHADRNMDCSTGVRFHVVELLFSTLLRVPVVLLLGMQVEQLIVYEMLALPVVLLHHANLRLPARLDSAMRLLLVSPRMHRVHHRVEYANCNSNYSSVLSAWDRIFGSFTQPKDIETARLGIDGLETNTLWQMLALPFGHRDIHNPGKDSMRD